MLSCNYTNTDTSRQSTEERPSWGLICAVSVLVGKEYARIYTLLGAN